MLITEMLQLPGEEKDKALETAGESKSYYLKVDRDFKYKFTNQGGSAVEIAELKKGINRVNARLAMLLLDEFGLLPGTEKQITLENFGTFPAKIWETTEEEFNAAEKERIKAEIAAENKAKAKAKKGN